MTALRIFLILTLSNGLWGLDLLKDFDSLGGNAVLLKKLKGHPQNNAIQIVQKRMTDRTHRWEFSSDYLYTSRGNSYLNSTSTGLSVAYHLNPRWSFGAKYYHFFNELTQEGRGLLTEAQKVKKINPNIQTALIPELNWPKDSVLASLSYYPIYGKVNLFNQGVVHFDIYGTLGAGQITLRQGDSTTYFTGVGIGFWLSQHLTSRLEYNYQAYNAQYLLGDKEQRINTISFGIGYLL